MKRQSAGSSAGRASHGSAPKRVRTAASISSTVDGLMSSHFADGSGPDSSGSASGGFGGDSGDGADIFDNDGHRGELYAAVLYEGEKLGIAYYDADAASLHATSMFCTAGDLPWVLATFKQQLAEREPSVFVVSSHIPEAIRRELARRTDAEAEQEGGIPVRVLQHSTFRLELARSLLASVQIPDWQPRRQAIMLQAARAGGASSAAAGAGGAAAAGAGVDARIMGLGDPSRPGTALSLARSATAASASAAAYAAEQQQRPGTAALLHTLSSVSSAYSAAAAPASLEMALARLSSVLDVNDDALLRVAGGLLHYLVKQRVISEMDAAPPAASAAAQAAAQQQQQATRGGSRGGGSAGAAGVDAVDAQLALLAASAADGGFSAGAAGGGFSARGPFGACLYLHGGVHVFSLQQFMHVDPVTYAALGVFATAAHPGLVRGGGKAKEGFSLFALLDRTASAPGRRLLRAWLRQPSLDLDVLQHRHDAVAFLCGAKGQAPELWRELRANLRSVKDAARLLLRLKRVSAGPAEWFALHRTVLAANMIRDLLGLLLRTVRLGGGGAGASSGGGGNLGGGLGGGGGPASRVPTTPLHPSALVGMHAPSSASAAAAAAAGASGDAAGGANLSLPPQAGGPPYSAQAPFLLRQVLAEFSAELGFTQSALDGVVDWEGSRDAGRLRVREGLDSTLDEYRRIYANLPQFLENAGLQVLAAHPSLASLAVKYLPQIGCVVCVDKADNGLAPSTADAAAAAGLPGGSAGAGGGGSTAAYGGGASSGSGGAAPRLVPMAASGRAAATIPPGWVLQFETGGALHFKSAYTDELDDYLGDIAAVISDLEASIVRQLEERVLEQEALLLTVAARLAEVDVLMAFADVSLDYRYVRPRLVGDNVLYVKGARHPLQELTVETFVPNDVALAPGMRGAGAVAIVTGPNFSGKSVYLKTAGLIPLMAQAGCFVPAERAVLGLVDRLFSRIHSLETAALGQSTFTIDLNQVGLMLRHATPRSLLLIDEFGKGTSSVDGVSLLAATIRHILRAPARAAAAGARAGAGEGRGPAVAAGGSDGEGSAEAAGGEEAAARARAAALLTAVPKTVITTHFREVFDHGLLALEGLGDTDGPSSSGTAAAPPGGFSASSLPDLSSNVSFYQMNVMLGDRPASAAASGGSAFAPGSRASTAASGTGYGFSGAGSADSSFRAGAEAGGGLSSAPDYEDDVVPLFRLVPGRAASSYGLACALRAGVPRFVTDRAAAVSSMLKGSAAVSPLAGHLEDPARRAVERAQLQLVRALLTPASWHADDDANATATLSADGGAGGSCRGQAASSQDVQELVRLLSAACGVFA